MNNKVSLIFFAFLTTSIVVHGGWRVATIALDCSSAPYSLYAVNGMCMPVEGRYLNVIRRGDMTIMNSCTSPDCSTGCKTLSSNPLNVCDRGVTLQFYEQEPPWEKYFGEEYVINYIYNTNNCTEYSAAAYVYPLNQCINSIDQGTFTLACDNNQIKYSAYNDVGCTDLYKQKVVGVSGVCEDTYYLWKCPA